MKFQHIRESILRSAGNHPYRFGLLAASPILGAALILGPALQPGTAEHTATRAASEVAAPSAPAHAALTEPQAATGSAAPAASAPAGTAPATTAPAKPPAPAAPKPPETRTLPFNYQRQINYYYCGPAAASMVANTFGSAQNQDTMAGILGTTPAGTNSAVDITAGLNRLAGRPVYHTTMIPGRPNAAQIEQLRVDIVTAISQNRGVVANIVGGAADSLGNTRVYSGGHYLAVVGYGGDGRGVMIADSADPIGGGTYWMNVWDLANWMSTRGYSS